MKIKIRNFKITDPIVQTILFLVFTWCLNINVGYRVVFYLLLLWQLMSALLHLTFKKITKLKKERKIHLVAFSIYLALYFVVIVFFPAQYVNEQFADGFVKIPVYDLVFISLGMVICFWYSVICFREIKRIVEKNFHN